MQIEKKGMEVESKDRYHNKYVLANTCGYLHVPDICR